MAILDIILTIMLGVGVFFNILGVVGLLRFPDVYTRLHAATKTTTFGSIFISLAVIIYGIYQLFYTGEGQYLTLSLHTLIAVIALALTNATGAHAIARAAHRSGVLPNPAVVDRLAEVQR
ncbi:MAG TPA: monovalent cation/H(+) antiporter subunit G, partial [Methanomicrobiales archaeon]|nr:monovalent cation/H(+) antiporter subunit G [Methanomicrobiales archaeon]